MILAGLPPTTTLGGTSAVTTPRKAMTELSPIVTPLRTAVWPPEPDVLADDDGLRGDGGVGIVTLFGVERVEVAVEDDSGAEDAALAEGDAGVGHDPGPVEARA